MNIKKTIAPIIVSFCLLGYYISISIVLIKFNIPNAIKLIVIIASSILSLVIVMVLIERLKEIKGGEEDDLGKY